MSVWVADASPLLYLAHLERLDLLRAEGREVLAPGAVLQEVRAHADAPARAIEDAATRWLKVRDPADPMRVAILRGGLDPGEAAAIALALELNAERLVVDDLDARRACRRLGVPVVGTLGVLVAAKKRGEIESVRAALERLEADSFRVSSSLRALVLAEAGEAE